MTEMLWESDVHRIRSAAAQLDDPDSPVSGWSRLKAAIRSSCAVMATLTTIRTVCCCDIGCNFLADRSAKLAIAASCHIDVIPIPYWRISALSVAHVEIDTFLKAALLVVRKADEILPP